MLIQGMFIRFSTSQEIWNKCFETFYFNVYLIFPDLFLLLFSFSSGQWTEDHLTPFETRPESYFYNFAFDSIACFLFTINRQKGKKGLLSFFCSTNNSRYISVKGLVCKSHIFQFGIFALKRTLWKLT